MDVEKKIAFEISTESTETNVSKTHSKEESKTCANPSTLSTTSTNTAKKVTESKKTEKKSRKEEEEEEEENENKIRGYKLTTDGRKTTFFNNEMDEQTKALIGDIAPQKIENLEGVMAQGVNASMSVSNGSSAWNAAGTFESVDHCKLMFYSAILFSSVLFCFFVYSVLRCNVSVF